MFRMDSDRVPSVKGSTTTSASSAIVVGLAVPVLRGDPLRPGSAWAARCAPAIVAVGGSATHSNSPLDENLKADASGLSGCYRSIPEHPAPGSGWTGSRDATGASKVSGLSRSPAGPISAPPQQLGGNSSFPGFGSVFFYVPLVLPPSPGCSRTSPLGLDGDVYSLCAAHAALREGQGHRVAGPDIIGYHQVELVKPDLPRR